LIKHYFPLTVLIITLLVFSAPEALAKETNTSLPFYRDMDQDLALDKEVFNSMIKNFELLSFLLQDVYQQENYYIPVHGKNLQELTDYLAVGFEKELASDIIHTYIQWTPELNKPAVIPCDAIPILTNADIDKIGCFTDKTGNIFFYRFYENCYNQGDKYYYEVSNYFTGEKWKIQSIKLEAMIKEL